METNNQISTFVIQEDPWASLKAFTNARIALGRTGCSMPLRQSLQFKLAHAAARDAVFEALNTRHIFDGLTALGLSFLWLHSKAADRQQYLQRPDLGREPGAASVEKMLEEAAKEATTPPQLLIVLADGLSAAAINLHALPLLQILLPQLADSQISIGPVCVFEQGRVAIADQAGEIFTARLTLILIGERPGLSAPDSLGAYITYAPKPGINDAARNCVSNIRQQGLSYGEAAGKILYLLQNALQIKGTGVALKEMSTVQGLPELRL